jgi:hypothetical protein
MVLRSRIVNARGIPDVVTKNVARREVSEFQGAVLFFSFELSAPLNYGNNQGIGKMLKISVIFLALASKVLKIATRILNFSRNQDYVVLRCSHNSPIPVCKIAAPIC